MSGQTHEIMEVTTVRGTARKARGSALRAGAAQCADVATKHLSFRGSPEGCVVEPGAGEEDTGRDRVRAMRGHQANSAR